MTFGEVGNRKQTKKKEKKKKPACSSLPLNIFQPNGKVWHSLSGNTRQTEPHCGYDVFLELQLFLLGSHSGITRSNSFMVNVIAAI